MEIKRRHGTSEFRPDRSARPGSIAQRLVPILGWLPGYRRDWLLPDILAGLAVWAVMVPEGMAYAGIVGVPPIMGLYTIVPPLIVYALLGTSRLLVVGPDTATGLISALTVGAVAAQATAEFNALTSTLAILIGAFFLLFGALRMGWVAAFIPTPVMRGFIEGLVCVTIIGQVPHLLGIDGTSGNFFAKLWFVVQHLGDTALAPVLTGLLSLIAMQLLRHLAPRVPAALVVAVAATILVGLLGGEAAGVSVVGELPSGLPHFALPNLDPAVWRELVPGALAIVLVGYAEALGGAKAATMQGGGDIDPNQELIAHGPANILSGLFGGFLVVGSLSKTSVAMAAGARTQTRQSRRSSLLLPDIGFVDAVVPGHAASSARRHRDRGNASPLQARVFARSVRAQPLGVRPHRACHCRRADIGCAAWHLAGCRAVAADVDLSDQPPPGRGARPAAGRGGLSGCPAPPRGDHLPRFADLAHWRRTVLCECRPPRRGAEGGGGGQLVRRRSTFFSTQIRWTSSTPAHATRC